MTITRVLAAVIVALMLSAGAVEAMHFAMQPAQASANVG